MFVIEEFRVTNNGLNLVLGVRVRKESYYDDVYIREIYIDTEETYVEGGPSRKAARIFYDGEKVLDKKEFRIILKLVDLNIAFLEALERYLIETGETYTVPDNVLTKHLFFAYIVTDDAPLPDTPCGMDECKKLGVTMYMGDFYNEFMNYIKELGTTCSLPQGFIDLLLRKKALDTSMDAGQYTLGIMYYNKWFKGNSYRHISTSKCGCHG